SYCGDGIGCNQAPLPLVETSVAIGPPKGTMFLRALGAGQTNLAASVNPSFDSGIPGGAPTVWSLQSGQSSSFMLDPNYVVSGAGPTSIHFNVGSQDAAGSSLLGGCINLPVGSAQQYEIGGWIRAKGLVGVTGSKPLQVSLNAYSNVNCLAGDNLHIIG